MQNKLEAFIDSYDYITILVDKTIDSNTKAFYLKDKNNKKKLEILDYIKEQYFNKYIVKFIPTIELHKDYNILDESGNITDLKSGAIIREEKFEQNFYYDGPLGVDYSNTRTNLIGLNENRL